MDPERMRAAVADYVTALHQAYLAQADTFPPAVRGSDALADRRPTARRGGRGAQPAPARDAGRARTAAGPGGGDRRVAARARLDTAVLRPRGRARARADLGGRRARLRRGAGGVGHHDRRLPRRRPAGVGAHTAPRGARRRRARGGAHRGGARLRAIRTRVPGREALVDELVGAAHAGLPRAQALLARAIVPRNPAVAALAEAPNPDPDEVRKALLASVGGRPGWTPPHEAESSSRHGESSFPARRVSNSRTPAAAVGDGERRRAVHRAQRRPVVEGVPVAGGVDRRLGAGAPVGAREVRRPPAADDARRRRAAGARPAHRRLPPRHRDVRARRGGQGAPRPARRRRTRPRAPAGADRRVVAGRRARRASRSSTSTGWSRPTRCACSPRPDAGCPRTAPAPAKCCSPIDPSPNARRSSRARSPG